MIPDFEIIAGKEFLNHFLDKRDLFYFSPAMVEKLRADDSPQGRYGYGRWLYMTGDRSTEQLRTVRHCLEFAAANGIADALYMVGRLHYNGDFFDDEKGLAVMNRNLADKLLHEAEAKGSDLAGLQRNFDDFNTLMGQDADAGELLAEAKGLAGQAGASLLWLEQLGWMYYYMGKRDEAIAAHEKCVECGLLHTIGFLASMYYERGNIAYYESLMQDAIEKDVAECMVLGVECEEDWDSYDAATRDEIHLGLDKNLRRGVELGNSTCAYYLAKYMLAGSMGFEKNIPEAFRYARIGMGWRCPLCHSLMIEILNISNVKSLVPAITPEFVLMARLNALRFGVSDAYRYVIAYTPEYKAMGYADELEYWKLQYEKVEEAKYNLDLFPTSVADNNKTNIPPTVLVIAPSGLTNFVQADVEPMSYKEMARLIDAEGVDAVHFSNPLNQITKDCGLPKQLSMYVDRNANAKNLPDNPVATMLYGNACEIRGAVIIVMEDNRYDTYSFTNKEDIEAVYEAINDLTGLLRRNDG
ncbi:MAG: hypothetical protein IIV89_00715 [Bacteroidaceae bacterium]|nr:hypothetical protein [Bacteroidaceae bacterium]